MRRINFGTSDTTERAFSSFPPDRHVWPRGMAGHGAVYWQLTKRKRKMLDNPIDRAAAARRIVSASDVKDPLDERSLLLRSVMKGQSIALRVPVRSIEEVKRLMSMLELEARSIRADLQERAGKASDQTMLFGVVGRLRTLQHRLESIKRGVPPLEPGRVKK